MSQIRPRVARILIVSFFLLASSLEAAHVVSVTLCEDVVQPDLVPVNIRDRFTTAAPAIHAIAIFQDVRPGSRIKAAWISVDAISTPNYEIDSAEVVAEGSNVTAHFALSRPNKGWPTGNYKLNLYVDGKLKSVTTFPIVAQPGAGAATPVKPQAGDSLPSRGVPPPSAQPPGDVEPSGGFSGRYVLDNQGTTLTLTLNQDAKGQITGQLTSTTGARFVLEGQVEEGQAMGICSGENVKIYFQALLEGNQLQLALIEPDANNMPDYNRVRELTLTRQAGARADRGVMPPRGFGARAANPMGSTAGEPARGAEVGDPSWGFRFLPPAGWKVQNDANGAILGHDTIAGVILVMPHVASSFQEVQQQMLEGMSEEGTQLRLTGRLQALGNSAAAGDYEGFYQNQRVRARGIGTFSPHGGGAYILAVATPEKHTPELAAAAEALAAGMRYSQPQMSEVAQYFVGTWVNTTTNTMTSFTLTADGTFTSGYEASYSGNQLPDGTTDWGTARNDQERGRWMARGTRERGVILLRYADGRQESVEYRVHVEKGQVYWREYWFDGKLYARR